MQRDYGQFVGYWLASTPKAHRLRVQGTSQWYPMYCTHEVGKDTWVAPLWLLKEKGIEPCFDNPELEQTENEATAAAYTETALKPFAHQMQAFNKMVGVRSGALFMEMGTGKTKVALDLANARFKEGLIQGLIYFCPVSVKHHIEGQMYLHKQTIPYVIIGIESLSNGLVAYSKAVRFIEDHTKVLVVVDEAHLLKNYDSIRSKRVQTIATKAAYSLALTGTPVTQSPADLYGIFAALDPNRPLLGHSSWGKFEKHHLVLGGHNKKAVIGYRNMDKLIAHIAPNIYQVTKSECLDLPNKLYQSRTIELPKEARERYEEIKSEALTAYQKKQNHNIILKMFTELQKVSSIGNGAKIKAVLDLITEAQIRLVIWCKYTAEILALEEAIKPINPKVATYYGATPQSKRVEVLADWRANQTGILIANMATGGHGIDLIEGNYCIYYSNSFKYAERVQSEDRFHRIGQRNPVTYVDLWTDTGMDRIIASCLNRKQDLAEGIKQLIENNQFEKI